MQHPKLSRCGPVNCLHHFS